MSTIMSGHISVDEHGVARIAASRITVMHLVMDRMATGWTPEQIQAQYPQLSLSQIYAAFAYYYDHQSHIDEQIRKSAQRAAELQDSAGPSPVADQLRAMGKLP